AGAADPNIPEIPAILSDLQELRQQLTQAPIAKTVKQAYRTLAAIEKAANLVSSEIGPLAQSARGAFDSADRTMTAARAAVEHLDREATATLGEARGLAHEGRQQLAARGEELSRALVGADKTLKDIDQLSLSANSLLAPRSQARSD